MIINYRSEKFYYHEGIYAFFCVWTDWFSDFWIDFKKKQDDSKREQLEKQRQLKERYKQQKENRRNEMNDRMNDLNN